MAAGLVHRLDQAECALHVDLIVEKRVGDRLTNSLQPGEVYDRLHVVLCEHLAEGILVADIQLHKGGRAAS